MAESGEHLDWASLIEARDALAVADAKLAAAGLPERGQTRDHLNEAARRVGNFITVTELENPLCPVCLLPECERPHPECSPRKDAA